jgi:hexosaminidase
MKHGRDVVYSPVFPTYFDYSQELSESEPLAIGGPVTLEDVLAFKPIDGVLGVQCQMWTEYVENPTHLEYMMWPRAAALAFAAFCVFAACFLAALACLAALWGLGAR